MANVDESARDGGNGDAQSGWLSVKEASVLTGVPPERLRQLVSDGTLPARTIERNGKARVRLTRAALVEAGLLGDRSHTPDAFGHLVALIREQNRRIAELEDQRAQLAARLGATAERMRQLEERLLALPTAGDGDTAAENEATSASQPIRTDDGLVLEATESIVVGDDGERQRRGLGRSLARFVRDSAAPRLRDVSREVRRRGDGGSTAHPVG
jgi:DNA-binding transcriptional MerR regulator